MFVLFLKGKTFKKKEPEPKAKYYPELSVFRVDMEGNFITERGNLVYF